MADRDFRKCENEITSPADMIRNSQFTTQEIKIRREGIKSSEIPKEQESKMEHLTATYWG